MEVKRTIKTDLVLKNARLINGKIIDEDGEVVSLPEAISKIYGEDEFKLTLTRSTSEEVDIEDVDEVDIDDLT